MKLQLRVTEAKYDGDGYHIRFVIEDVDVEKRSWLFRKIKVAKTIKSDSLYCTDMNSLDRRLHGILQAATPKTPVADKSKELIGKTYRITP